MQHAFMDTDQHVSVGRTVGPTDINNIPKQLSVHILLNYVHDECKISLFQKKKFVVCVMKS